MKEVRRRLTGFQGDSGLRAWVGRKLHLGHVKLPLALGQALPRAQVEEPAAPQARSWEGYRDHPVPDLTRLGPGMTVISSPQDAFLGQQQPNLVHPALRPVSPSECRPILRTKSSPALRTARDRDRSLAPPLPGPAAGDAPQTALGIERVLVTLDEYERLVQRDATLSRLDPVGHPPAKRLPPLPPQPYLAVPPSIHPVRPKRSIPNLNRTALQYASQMLADLADQVQNSSSTSLDSLPTFYMEEPGPMLNQDVYVQPLSAAAQSRVAR